MGICGEIEFGNNNNRNIANRVENQEANIGQVNIDQRKTILIDTSRFKELEITNELKSSYIQAHNSERQLLKAQNVTEEPLLSYEGISFAKKKMQEHLGQSIKIDNPKYLNEEVGYNIAFVPNGEKINGEAVVGSWVSNKSGQNSLEYLQVIWGPTKNIGVSIIEDEYTGEKCVVVLYYPKSNKY